MNCSMVRRVLTLLWGAVAGLCPLLASALGLGDLQVESRLNQPLRARIQVSDINDDEWRVLRAHLSAQSSQSDGALSPVVLDTVTFKNVEDESHRRFIEVRSVDPVTEPLFDLSIDVAGPELQVTRNYTVFLDPPGPGEDQSGGRGPALASQPAAPARQSITAGPVRQSTAEAQTGTASEGAGIQGGTDSAPRHEQNMVVHSHRKALPSSTAPGAGAAVTTPASGSEVNAAAPTYTVNKSDTLEKIARRFGGTTAAHRNQFMDWVFQHNPTAFYGDMNHLRAGARLGLPEEAGTPKAATLAGADAAPVGLKGPAGTDLTGVTPAPGAADPSAKAQLQGQLSSLQQELVDLQKMLAQQDEKIASLKQQIAASEEQQRQGQAEHAPAANSDAFNAQVSAARATDSASRAHDEQPDAARSTAALARADHADVTPFDETLGQANSPESAPSRAAPDLDSAQSAAATSSSDTATTSSQGASSYSTDPTASSAGAVTSPDAGAGSSDDVGASRHGIPGLWARYRVKTSAYYWTAGIVVLAGLIAWLAVYVRRRIEDANPQVDLRYPVGPTFERDPEAAQPRTNLMETLSMARSAGAASAASKLSVALKRPESDADSTDEHDLEHAEELGHAETSAAPQSGLDTWRTQTALLEQDILSETDVLPFVLDTRNQLKILDEEEMLAPTELTRESQEIANPDPTETLPEMLSAAPTQRLPRAVAEEIARRAVEEQVAQEQAPRHKPADENAGGQRAAPATPGMPSAASSETVVQNTSDLAAERSATNKEIVKALESSLDYQPDRVDIQLKLLEIYHHEALDNRENFHTMLRKLADLKDLSAAQRLHVEMLQRTLHDGDSSFVAEEEV